MIPQEAEALVVTQEMFVAKARLEAAMGELIQTLIGAKLRAVDLWLQSCLGGPPAQVHLTNPKQQFNIVCDVSGLMRILGGEWLRVIADAEAKASAQAGRRGIQTEGEEGNFLGSVKKFKTTPPDSSEAGLNADYSARNEKTK